MKRGCAAVIGSMLVLIVTACAERDEGRAADRERAGGIAVVCSSVLPESLNAFTSADLVAADLRLLLFTPLVLYDSAGGVRPHLARRWEWQDEQRELRLHLRDDVRWHDGQPLTAEDVAWTLRAAADSSFTYSGWGDLRTVRGIVVRDPTTVDVRFAAPFVAGLEPFIQLPILPVHLLRDVPASEFSRADYHRAPVGSGPFRFAARTLDGALHFDRFTAFPEELGRALLDRIVLRRVPEPSVIMIELQTRAVDLCLAGSSLAQQVGAAAGLRALGLAPTGVQVLYLSVRRTPFTDARVRRAVSAALLREQIAATVSPLARPARTYLPAGAERWLDPDLLEPDADSAYAAALLDSAGWNAAGVNGIRRNAAGEPLRFTIAAPPAFEVPLTVVQAQLRRLGMDARLQFMEGAAFVAMIRDPAARADAMALSLFPDKLQFPSPRAQLHASGSVNLSGYANPRVDSLIQRLDSPMDDAERARIYHEIQRHVAEDVPIVYVAYFPRMLAIGPRLQGVSADLNGPFSAATSWWIPPSQRRGVTSAVDTATLR